MSVRLLLADDHRIVRQGLKLLLEEKGFAVVGEADDGFEAVQLARELQPDVAILDLVMPLVSGIQCAREIRRELSNIKVVLLTMFLEERYVMEALEAGVSAYVMKSDAATDLHHALNQVLEGATYFSTHISQAIVRAYLRKTAQPDDPLTPRELEILKLIAEGKTSNEVAGALGLKVKTVETHRMKVMAKLGLRGTAELVRYAVRQGFVAA